MGVTFPLVALGRLRILNTLGVFVHFFLILFCFCSVFQMDQFMNRLKTLMNDKLEREAQEKIDQRKKFRSLVKEREHMRKIREKRMKAQACRKMSKKQGSKNLNML